MDAKRTQMAGPRAWLECPVSAGSLAVFRISLGVTCVFWAIHYLVSGRAELLCQPDSFHFTWPGFDWVRPWPGRGMQLQFVAMALAGAAFAAGLATQFSGLVLAIGITHFFLIDRTNYQNHYYLLMLLLWLSPCLPLGRFWAMDASSGMVDAGCHVPRWAVFLLQFHVALPYIFGGISKLDADWLSGRPMQFLLMQRFGLSHDDLIARLGGQLLAWGGLLFDLLIVPGLLWRPIRLPAWSLLLTFHLTNAWLFPIHVFPWLMLALSTVFLPADWPLAVQRRLLGVRSDETGIESFADTAPRDSQTVRSSLLIPLLIGGYCLFHCVWPLRSFVYGDVTGWTERGHYFAWRMMLRGKTTGLRYYMTDPVRGETWVADISRLLNAEQSVRFATDPEMILHLGRMLADLEQRRSGVRPVVRVLALSSLNGRRPQLLIDPEVNLAAEPLWPRRRSWIRPLTEPLPDRPWTVPKDEWEQHVNLPLLPWQARTRDRARRCTAGCRFG
jgi:vitamin K-dependent gamma-carboxylase